MTFHSILFDKDTPKKETAEPPDFFPDLNLDQVIEAITAVLFNESFAATNEREGSEIARQIVNALLEKQIKVFYVTHLYDLAHSFHIKGMGNAIFLRADRKEKGYRTCKLIEAPPLKTSYGVDAYNKIFGEQK